MEALLKEIKSCTLCVPHLELGANPVVRLAKESKIMVIGQAPGTKVHASGIPWDDASGKQLRRWLGVDEEAFYDTKNFGIMPMGFCYPGKGKTGDLPPRKKCAPQWHSKLWAEATEVKLTLLIGQYAQKHYLGEDFKKNLTETVKSFDSYLPKYLPLPHPSPRNRYWLKQNPWFEDSIVDYVQKRCKTLLYEN